MPRKLIVPQIKTKFYDMDVYIPENHIDNLLFMYGEGWKTPVAKYYDTKLHKENSKRFRRYFR